MVVEALIDGLRHHDDRLHARLLSERECPSLERSVRCSHKRQCLTAEMLQSITFRHFIKRFTGKIPESCADIKRVQSRQRELRKQKDV